MSGLISIYDVRITVDKYNLQKINRNLQSVPFGLNQVKKHT
jgi:hypothetical protein